MYFIKKDGKNLGNPMSQTFDGCVVLPDELLSAYLDTKGFCTVTVDEDNVVTAVAVNQDALSAYDAEHSETVPEEPVSVETLQEENAKLKQQVAALTDQQSFYEDCIAEMAQVVYA